MQKNLNDIIPPSRRRAMMGEGITTPPGPRMESMDMPLPDMRRREQPTPPPMRPMRPEHSTGFKFPFGTAIIAILVIAGSVGALFFFSGAKVAITPTTSPVTIENTLDAVSENGSLQFIMVSTERTVTSTIDAESTENVSQAAQGTIIVENTQDAPQTLIKNTRFESPSGLVFRIKESISVPAAKNGAPGTLSVTVYADAAGEAYNIAATTFTVPGLKGSDIYAKVTARSTDAMKGGFEGARPTVSTATKEAEMAKLQTTLDAELAAAIAAEIEPGYVLLPGATATTYDPQPDTAAAGNKVTLSERGVIRAVIFPEEALASAIAYQSIGTYSGEPLAFESLDALRIAPAEGLIPNAGDTSFSFTLTGSTNLVWKVDADKIAAAVAGKTRTSAENVLQGFPEVNRALLVLKPFWVNSFPSDPAKITVSVDDGSQKEAKK